MHARLARGLARRAAAIVGHDAVLTEPGDCWPYGYDNSRRHSPPAAVVFPTSHEQVRDLLRLCHDQRLPVVARGRGTGTTGGAVPVRGGLVLALERMDRILELDTGNRLLRAEPGVLNGTVQEVAGRAGFFWPPDPSSAAYCTIGGNLAFNSAGPRAVKYGTPRDNTLGLRAVTGDGRELRTGVCTTKGVVGYDLTRLIIGSEGTLAVITEATLRLSPLPQSRRGLKAVYRDVGSAARAIERIMAQPVVPSALELIDRTGLDLVRGWPGVSLPDSADTLLMVEVDGPLDCIAGATAAVCAAADGPGIIEIAVAEKEADLDGLWSARKALSPALRSIAPKKINEDVVVPVTRLAELLQGLERLSREFAITIVSFGHAGNGNIHTNLLLDTDDPAQAEQARRCLARVFDLVLGLRGTLSGEHGVGLEKRDFVDREIDPPTLDLMRRIKAQFDPRGILNPEKVFPLAGR
jgi:D-lactate dehydrogenase